VTRRSIIAAVLTAAFASYMTGETKSTSTVRIHATDQFGKGLTPIQVTRFVEQRVGGRDYADRFVGSEAKEIPYGDYIVSGKAANIQIGGPIHIGTPETFLVLSGGGIIADFASGANPVTRGMVVGMSSETKKPVWIRIINLYRGLGSYQTLPVANDGSFSAGLLLPGSYFLAIHDGAGVLFSATLEVPDLSDALVKIDLIKRMITVQPAR
jgi:hypothetical protein